MRMSNRQHRHQQPKANILNYQMKMPIVRMVRIKGGCIEKEIRSKRKATPPDFHAVRLAERLGRSEGGARKYNRRFKYNRRARRREGRLLHRGVPGAPAPL